MSNLGELLREERKKQNISLAEISAATNLNYKLLEQLENNDFTNIPARFYLKNFIREYLRSIDVSPEPFLQNHKSLLNSLSFQEKPSHTSLFDKMYYYRFRKRKLLFTLLAATIILAAVLIFVYLNHWPAVKSFFSGMVTPETADEQTLLLDSAWIVCPGSAAMPFPGDQGAPLKAARIFNPWSPVTSPLTVQAEFSEKCWIRILRGQQAVLEKTAARKEKISINGYRIRIIAGNPSVMQLRINGKIFHPAESLHRPAIITLTPGKTRIAEVQ